jgi:hypothetical protein
LEVILDKLKGLGLGLKRFCKSSGRRIGNGICSSDVYCWNLALNTIYPDGRVNDQTK